MRKGFYRVRKLAVVVLLWYVILLLASCNNTEVLSSPVQQTNAGSASKNDPCYRQFGVNLSGAEWDDSAYHPTVSELHYYSGKGVRTVRLSLRWDRLQPTLSGPLNSGEINWLKSYLEQANLVHISVIVDLHIRSREDDLNFKAGTELPPTALVDLWTKMATVLGDVSGICGYDIANEPNHTDESKGLWVTQANEVIKAIRKIDTKHYVFFNEDNWTPSRIWNVKEAEQIIDSADRLVYEAHSYWDRDGSGTYTPNILPHDEEAAKTLSVNNLAAFINWCGTTYRCFVGEFGVPSNQIWLVSLDAALQYMKEHHIAGTYWAGGPGWRDERGDYILSIEPYPDGTDKAQMKVLKKYLV